MIHIDLYIGMASLKNEISSIHEALRCLRGMLERIEETMAIDRGALDAQLTQLAQQLQGVGTDIGNALTNLLAKISSGQDFSSEATQIQGMSQALQNVDADVLARGGFPVPTPVPPPIPDPVPPDPTPAPEPVPDPTPVPPPDVNPPS